jgi:hypothetical protein
MNIIGVQIFVAKILAHLSPPEVARIRLLNKDICARISAGTYAQMFWRHDSYQQFLHMLCVWQVNHVKQAAKWFCDIDQFMKFELIRRPRYHTVKMCIDAGIITRLYPMLRNKKLRIELVFALIENLCTLDEVVQCNNDLMMNYGFKSNIIPNLLRKRKYDVMKHFRDYSNHQKDKLALMFKIHNNYPFSVEEVLEYCISRDVKFPFVLIYTEVCANIQKGLWTWKEVIDHCIENQGEQGEITVGLLAEKDLEGLSFQEALVFYFIK